MSEKQITVEEAVERVRAEFDDYFCVRREGTVSGGPGEPIFYWKIYAGGNINDWTKEHEVFEEALAELHNILRRIEG